MWFSGGAIWCHLSSPESGLDACTSGEPILSPLFPIQPIDNAPVAGVGPCPARQCKITHIYPNFLFLGRQGTPSFPPVIAACTRKPFGCAHYLGGASYNCRSSHSPSPATAKNCFTNFDGLYLRVRLQNGHPADHFFRFGEGSIGDRYLPSGLTNARAKCAPSTPRR